MPAIERLPILIVNVYGRCNCRCAMCDIWKRDTPDRIELDRFRTQLPAIEQLNVEQVVFSGGEPLMHPDLFQFCAELRQRRIAVTLLSSGLLLERHADAILSHVDDLIVSLDGPSSVHDEIRGVTNAFALLKRGVARLGELSPRLPIAGRCTVQRRNCGHLTATVAAARALGLNSISFLAADIHSTAFNRSHPLPVVPDGHEIAPSRCDLDILDREIEALIASGDCGGYVVESPAKLRKIADRFRASLGLTSPVAPMCNAPWISAVIEADGSLRPCFFHAPVGRLSATQDVGDVLNGPEAIAFRERLNVAEDPTCRRCVCSLHRQPGA